MSSPNFFQIAKSELTQDAFIQWLLEWANPQYKETDCELHNAAISFVRLLLLPNDSKEDLHISSIECEAQKNNIDVLALIKDVYGNKYAVVIEDKTDTTIHDDQLIRYSKDVKKKYKDYELHCVYFKTGNESKHSLDKIKWDYENNEWVIANKPIFKMVLRENVLKVLGSFSPKSVIYSDFIENLNRIQNLTDTYKKQDIIVGKWGNTAWQGFLGELEKRMNIGWWDNTHRKVTKNMKGRDLSGWNYQLPKLSISENKSIHIYLYLCLTNLYIKACCYPSCRSLKFDNIEEVNNKLANYDLKLVSQKGKQKSENITLATIIQSNGASFIDNNQSVDFNIIEEKLHLLHQLLSEFVGYIKIK